ncbi:MAG: anti-sigma F factor [Clostridia bacterium]|nr:anti-sigma F factor [Clostridia bacterium]
MKDMMKCEFPAKSVNEGFARVVVSAFASRLDPTVEELAEIKTAVSEAVTNVIIHGYQGGEGIIYIECEIKEKNLIVKISDKGAGIENVQLARTPLYTSNPDGERSGMGFTVMETFMDELEVKSLPGVGTTIIMKKQISSQEDEASE